MTLFFLQTSLNGRLAKVPGGRGSKVIGLCLCTNGSPGRLLCQVEAWCVALSSVRRDCRQVHNVSDSGKLFPAFSEDCDIQPLSCQSCISMKAFSSFVLLIVPSRKISCASKRRTGNSCQEEKARAQDWSGLDSVWCLRARDGDKQFVICF